MSTFMKQPCKHCPFRKDVQPFLHPLRGAELAYHATNPYNSFPCHKTTVEDEESDEGEMVCHETTKECAGFLTLQIHEGAPSPKGFTPASEIVYKNIYDMIDAYKTV